MDFNFETILTLLTLLTGLVWLADVAWLARRRERRAMPAGGTQSVPQDAKKPRAPVWIEYGRSFFPVLLVVLLLRSFLVEPFHIPSSSMMPTLLVGDFILVNKFDYGLRLPVTHTKFIPIGEPQRGDVVVFHFPTRSATRHCAGDEPCLMEIQQSVGTDFIKRIVGLPGDHIVYQGETLYVNGVKAPDKSLGLYQGPDLMGAVLHQETLGKAVHDTLILPGQPHRQGEWTVPAHDYFVMGDNRDNSWDSRYWGFVPEKDLVGKAFFVWMNWDAVLHPIRDAALWHRFGKVIR
ncbi:MAG: signal peptidase I [Gammaproteobacteria bacterium]